MTAERKFNALFMFMSAEPQQQREADGGNDRGNQNRNPKNHVKHSCVTGA